MGLEIERARALLAALTRDGVVPADRATASYEAWVASETEAPFARHLVRERPQDAERIRYLLRMLTVQGLPHPDRFTAERFEDLLMGQLGIEAGLLSAKLLQTVRAVQDKKVEEGKLRRLEELLPRAGFDQKALRLLRNHLAERVLICKGCLSRFPRRDKGALRLECPRCALELVVPACEASTSDVQDLHLSAEQQMQLEKSVSSEGSGVFETLTVAARERPRGPPPADASKAILPLVVTLGVVLLGVLLVSSRQPPPPPPLLPRPPATDGATEEPGQAGPTLAEVRLLDRRLAPSGKWAEILEAWRRAEPGPDEPAAEGKAEKARRVAELERLVSLSDAAAGLLDQARSRPDDEALEAALARTLEGAPTGSPPFDEVAAELERRRGRHAGRRREEGQRRLDAARAQAGSAGGDAWGARLAQARRGPPLMGVEVGGRVVDGLVIEGLDARGFTVRLPDGAVRTHVWSDDPPLALAILRRAADKSPADQLELLRRALCARDAATAAAAAAALGLGSLDLDPAALLAKAPLSAPCVALEGGGHRLRWSTRSVGHDLTAGRPIEVRPEGGLVVQGDKPQVSTPTVDVAQVDAARLVATTRLGQATRAHLAVDLGGARSRRSYVARWDESGWTLEVDLGAGSNVLKRGTGGGASRAARLEVAANEVALFLDGVERARAPTSAKFERVGVRVGAAAGPLVIEELALEGSIDPAWARRTEEAWAATVDAQVEAIGRRLARQGARLPVPAEEPRTGAGEAPLKAKLEAARAAFEAGKQDEAAAALRALEAEAPGFHAARLARGAAALLADDPATAVRALTPAAEQLPEAEALLALALARAGRAAEANERAGKALERRPDLVHAHLARTRLAWHDRDPVQPAPAESIEQGLRLAEALAPDDALVRLEAAALRRGLRLDASLPWRLVVGPHVLLASGPEHEAAAREMGKALEGLVLRYEQETREERPDHRPLAVALVDAQLLEGWGTRGEALWDPALGLLAARTTAGLGWDVAFAAAEGFVSRCHGAPPAWLEYGLAAWLAAPAAGEAPPGALEALERAPAWGPAKWRELFDAERPAVRQAPLLRARAFGLVALAAKQAPTQAVIAALLARSRRGEPAPWVDDPSLELQGLDAQVREAVQQRR